MSRNPLQQRLIQIVEPVVESSGFELVDLRFLLEQTGWTLRVQVSLPLPARADTSDLAAVPTDRVDLHDCENLSHELSAKLDVEDPIPQAYSLEVSSPGIDRALRTARHFAHFTGADARIALAVPLQAETGERRNFRGVLRGVDGDHVSIECDGQAFRLAIADIDHAKLVPDWDAVMHGRSGVGAPAPTPDKKSAKPAKPKHQKQQKEP